MGPRLRGDDGALTARGEERRQPCLDILRDLLTGAVFGVAEGALAGEALQLAGNVIGEAREGSADG